METAKFGHDFGCAMAGVFYRLNFPPSLRARPSVTSVSRISATLAGFARLNCFARSAGLPLHDLVSNWAYMVMAALAWNLKAWYGLLVPDRERGLELVRMEFRRFLQAIILLPVQIIRAGRRIVYRLLGYNGWLKDFFAAWQRLQKLELVE